MKGSSSMALFVGFFICLLGDLSTISGENLKPCEFTAIYNFGDSNSDTGGISPVASEQLPPPNAPGRASDGDIIIDFIAMHLKLPKLNAYPNRQEQVDFQKGANFASAGSTIRKQNQKDNEKTPLSLDVQIEQFNQFKSGKNASEKHKLPRQEDFVKALYIFDIGQNDLAFGNLTTKFDQIPDMINQLASAVQNIYQQGGRAFRIHNTGPLGCLPYFVENLNSTSTSNIDEHGCLKSRNELAAEFNRQLKEKVTKLRSELPEAALTYVDMYAVKYELISNAKKLGFDDPLKACCGIPGQIMMCGLKRKVDNKEMHGTACKEPSKFINWDGLHYTQAANQWVANQTFHGSFTDPAIPITQSCHRQ